MVVAPKRLPVPMPNPPAHQALPAQDGTIENIDRQTAVPPRPARGFLLPGRFKYDITVSTFSDKETDDPLHADRRNFYKVEEWSRDGLRVDAVRRQQPKQGAPHLRAHYHAPAVHPPHDPAAHAGRGITPRRNCQNSVVVCLPWLPAVRDGPRERLL
jgi:hypothetical protein